MARADQSKQYLAELIGLNKYNLIGVGYEKLTVAGTAVSMTVPAEAQYAEIRLESSITTLAVRHLQLGSKTLPVAGTGMPLFDTDVYTVIGYQNLVNFRAIQEGAGTHNLNIQYFK